MAPDVRIVALGVNHHTAPVEVRERLVDAILDGASGWRWTRKASPATSPCCASGGWWRRR